MRFPGSSVQNPAGSIQGSPSDDLIPLRGSATYRGILSGLPAALPRNACNSERAPAKYCRGPVLSLSRGGNPIPMSSFRRLALALALGLPAAHIAFAQAASSSSNPPAAGPQAGQEAPQAAQQQPSAAAQNQGSLSVQARIHARR